MDALLTTFLAALFAGIGGKTQLLVAALAARYGRPGPLFAGVAVGALASSLLAAGVGALLHDLITARAAGMLVALALVFAGVGGLLAPGRSEPVAGRAAHAVLGGAVGVFLAELGDRTQWLTGALAAQLDSFALAAAGATAGLLAASAPAIVLGAGLGDALPLRPLRIGAAVLFLVSGFIVGVNALRLI